MAERVCLFEGTGTRQRIRASVWDTKRCAKVEVSVCPGRPGCM